MATVDVLRYYLELDSKKFVADSKRAEMQTKSLSTTMGKVKNAIMGIAGAYLGYHGLRYAITSTIGAMARFEHAMDDVNTLLDVSEEQFKRLEKGVLAIAKQSPRAISELTKGLYDLISAGVSSENSLWALNEAQKAATAGSTSIKTAVAGAMATINAFSLDISELTRVFDLQFNTVKRGVLTFEQLGTSIGMVLPSAKQLGATLEEIYSGMALLTKAGFSADIAATVLSRTFTTLADPVTQKNFEQLGIQIYDINGKFIGTVRVLEQLRDKMQDMTDSERAMLFGTLALEQRAQRGFISLTNSVEDYAALIQEMTGDVGAMDRAHEKMRDSLINLWAELKNEFEATMIEFGDRHKQTLKVLINAASEFVRLIGEAATATTQFLAMVSNAVKAMWASIKSVWLKGTGEILLAFSDALWEIRKLVGEGVISVEDISNIGTAARETLLKSEEAMREVEDATLATLDAGGKWIDSLDEMLKRLKNIVEIFAGVNKQTKDIAFNLDKATKSTATMESGFVGPMPEKGWPYETGFVGPIQGWWDKLLQYLKDSIDAAAPAIMGAFDAIVHAMDYTSQRIYDIAKSFFSADLYSFGFNIISAIMDTFIGSSRKAEEFAYRQARALEEVNREIERNIEAVERLTIAQRKQRILAIQEEIRQIQVFYETWGTMADWLWEKLRGLRKELELLLALDIDLEAVRGIESFQDAMEYLSGLQDIDYQTAQRLFRYFTTMFDLSIEEQIEMWEMIRDILIANGNLTADQLLDIDEIIHDLYEQAEEERTERRNATDPESQIMRSITMITEHQANLMLSMLNSIYLTLREFLDAFRDFAANFNFGGVVGAGGGIGIVNINTSGATASAIAESVSREFRARGIKVG